MLLQDFIALWQAQPFRAFRLQTERGKFSVSYPQGVALSPEMQVLVVSDEARVERIALNEITAAEVYGERIAMADALRGVNPDTLARNVDLLSAAMNGKPPRAKPSPRPRYDSGRVSFLGTRAPDGRFVVQASVTTREGEPMFTTAGTRWNLHGTEKFENGTSLYLHHLDHPTEEQRVILWPPETGTFETFAEAKPLVALMQELRKRDAQRSAKPAKAVEPPAAYFREIVRTYPAPRRDGRDDAFGGNPDDHDFDRFEFHLVPHKTTLGLSVKNPCLVDVPAENVLFNLTKTDWNGAFRRVDETFALTLCHAAHAARTLELTVDPYAQTARLADAGPALPLQFVEHQLHHLVLHESWDALLASLNAGPVKRHEPDLTLPLPRNFRAEFWAGAPRIPLPFLQPRLLDPSGKTLLDLRATPWGAAVTVDATEPRVTVRLISDEEKHRHAPDRLTVCLDLVTQHVTSPGAKGATTLGIVQGLLRRVRGMKWWSEEFPACLKKGRALPAP